MNNRAMLDVLTGYARRGWRMFPCRSTAEEWTDRASGEVRTADVKTPLVKNWPQAATSDTTQIKRWLEEFPRCMWGCATGSASGFWALDLDRHEGGADGMAALREYVRKHGFSMQKTLAQRTAGGGWHLLYKMPEGAVIRNAAGVLNGVDVRGDGGFIVIAPSYNLDADAGYEWKDRGMPIAPPPPWLLALISQNNRQTSASGAKAPQAGAQAPYSGPDGGTAYGLQALRDEIATLRAAEKGTRNNQLNICAVKLFSLAAGGVLDADAVTRELEAAAVSIGLPYQEITATLASARRAGFASPRKAPEQAAEDPMVQVTKTPEKLEGPLPLRRTPQAQAEYPVACFLEFGQAVEDIANATDTPPSMVGGAMLAVMSWLAQRLANVKTPKYSTPLALFLLIIGETGDGKTTVENILSKPIKDKEKEYQQAYREELDTYKVELKAYERELAKLEKKTNLSREAYKTELVELEKTRPIAPVRPVFTIGDCNYEGVYRMLDEGLPYLGIFLGEGGRFFGGTAFAKENMLKTISGLTDVWSGGTLDKARRGEGVSKLYGRRICANIMVQPEVAELLFANSLLTGQGYLCRQLVSWPVPMMKKPEQTDIESLPSVQRFYRQCNELLALPVRTDDDNGGIIFDDLELSPEALEAYKRFFLYMEENRAADKPYEPVNGHAKRTAEQALRIAGCLSMMRAPASRVIPLQVMEAGIKIAEWYLDEVLRITLDDMASPEVLQAEKLLKWLHKNQIRKTAVKQILQYGPNSLREKKAVMPIIELLADHNWLVPISGGEIVQMGSKESYARQAWKVVYAVPDNN